MTREEKISEAEGEELAAARAMRNAYSSGHHAHAELCEDYDRTCKVTDAAKSPLPTRKEMEDRAAVLWAGPGSKAWVGQQHWADAFRNVAAQLRGPEGGKTMFGGIPTYSNALKAAASVFERQADELEARKP